jgi:predicted pore-forming effector associated with SMODS systems
MLSNLQTYTLMGIAALIWLPLSLIGFVNGGPATVLALSDALAIVVILVSAFERWGWRWRRLHPHVIGTPEIRGTWRGTLRSNWKDPATKKERPPKVVYLAIRQTLTTVWVRLLTDESVSSQMAGSLQKDPASTDWNLSYTYYNVPDIFLRKRSPEHRGGTFLTVNGEPPKRIHGEFWTSRDTKGTLDMDSHVSGVAQTFADAEALFVEGSRAG